MRRWADFDEPSIEAHVAGCEAAAVEPPSLSAGRCSLGNGLAAKLEIPGLSSGLKNQESGTKKKCHRNLVLIPEETPDY
jgi:hypothetical protein